MIWCEDFALYKNVLSLYSVAQVQTLEQQLLTNGVFSVAQLLRRAGESAWNTIMAHWPDCDELTICCGSGRNAGDGFVLAQLAKQHGCNVRVWAIEDLANLSAEVAEQAAECQARGIAIEPYQGQSVVTSSLIVDSLLGTGLNRSLDGRYQQLVQAINAAPAPVLSLDVPTGIDADSGKEYGQAVHADLTLTFILPKRGLYTGPGLACAGKVIYDDLAVDESILHAVQPVASRMDTTLLSQFLNPRRRHAHKGQFGHVLIIGGDYSMGGAVRMAAEAAMRVGAGLVSVATRPEHVSLVSGSRPELMCHSVSNERELAPLLQRASVVVIGPGLGKSEWSHALFTKAINCKKPMVIDADGLNLLSKEPRVLTQTVLTPHPGEAKRLLSEYEVAPSILSDRYQTAELLQRLYTATIALKGAGTVVQPYDGSCQQVCSAGNPGMASGGMGDVLSGVIGGLVAQGLSTTNAASLGVYIHAIAGDMAAKKGGERGLVASDLFNYLRLLANPNTDHPQQ